MKKIYIKKKEMITIEQKLIMKNCQQVDLLFLESHIDGRISKFKEFWRISNTKERQEQTALILAPSVWLRLWRSDTLIELLDIYFKFSVEPIFKSAEEILSYSEPDSPLPSPSFQWNFDIDFNNIRDEAATVIQRTWRDFSAGF